MKLEKITKGRRGARRTYEDACGAAHALDLVGERWSLLVIRELMLGPKRFSSLREDLPTISANLLAQRLRDLQNQGVVVKRRLSPPASVAVYELTPWGYESEPIFAALGRWGARSPVHDPTLHLSVVSLMLSFRTMFDRSRARGFEGLFTFHSGAEAYRVKVAGGRLTAERGADSDHADVRIEGTPAAVAAVVYGGASLEAALADGALTIKGRRRLFMKFTKLFPLPEKAASPLRRTSAQGRSG